MLSPETVNSAVNPTVNPAVNPTVNPAVNPTVNPSANPTVNPSANPTPRRCLVTSVVRHTNPDQTSGYLYLVDLSTGEVRRKIEAPENTRRAEDLNPRGGLRGLRGLTVWGDRVVVANTERLLVYDSRWRPVADLGHPLVGGIHDVLATEEGLWVASTSADLVVKLGWDGELLDVWEWRLDRPLVRALGFRRVPPVDRSRDYRDPESMRRGVPNLVHLNGLGRGVDGVLVSLGRVQSVADFRRYRLRGVLGAIASTLGVKRRRRPRPTVRPREVPGSSSALVAMRHDGTSELLCRVGEISVPNHNVHREGEVLVYNDSNGSRLVGHPLGRDRQFAVEIPGDPGFVRGLAHLGGLEFLVGNQEPLALYRVDLGAERVMGRILLGGVEHESTYGICLLPDSFDDPPVRLLPPENGP